MTENSDPPENAIAERVNGILKQELLEKRFESFRTPAKIKTTAATATKKREESKNFIAKCPYNYYLKL